MLPTCFSLEKIDNKTRLYMGEIITTSEALKAFPLSEPIQVTEFGAYPYKAKGWLSAKDLPPIKIVGEMIVFLEANKNLNLVDFSGRIGEDTLVSSHDDGEISFTVESDESALKIMRQFLDPKTSIPVESAVVANLGKYVSIPRGKVKIFDTFDDYIADDERPEYS